jgi:N-acetylneuraminate synthase/N,N'-diacetyllegionaminate synthase
MAGPFAIAGRPVGAPGAPAFVIAEAGVNHDGDVDAALALVDAAAEAGADAVKFQTFDPAALTVEAAPLADYQRDRGEASDQRKMLDRLRLPDAAFARLAERAAVRGIVFLSAPFDEGSAALLDGLDVAAFKLGSGELTNLPFLERVAAYGRPMILSTGMAVLDEVAAAVATVRAAGVSDVALLHCVSSYPTPVEQANVSAMDALRAAHPDVVVGYSDHVLGLDAAVASIARGAAILERHLTLDRGRPGPDHALSSEPDEFAELVRRVRATEAALGDGVKAPQAAEADVRAVARRSLVTARALRAGDTLDAAALTAKRPGGGLEPALLPSLVGRRVARDVAAGVALSDADLES